MSDLSGCWEKPKKFIKEDQINEHLKSLMDKIISIQISVVSNVYVDGSCHSHS